MSISDPLCVRITALVTAPNPAPTKNTARIAPPAAIFHRTHAEIASAINDKTTVHTNRPANTPHPIHRCVFVQSHPAMSAWMPNKINPGIQVIHASKYNTTIIRPNTYSLRVNGRHKNKGIALLVTSGETRLGPTIAVSKYAITD